MSSISFASPTGVAYLRGSERAWMGRLIYDTTIGTMGASFNRDVLLQAIPDDHYLRIVKPDCWADSFATFIRTSDLTLTAGDLAVDTFELVLNTALVIGGDAIKLAARLHGQCEMHAWVDGPNRAWLAAVIEHGRASSLFRPDMGWEEVCAFLLASDSEAVVTSYSVTDSFPYPDPDVPRYRDDMTHEEREAADQRSEDWYDLPDADRWADGMAWLKRSPAALELTPDGWDEYRFGPGVDTFRLMGKLRALQPTRPTFRGTHF